ncbi:hypothetical protein [Streptomyces sp. TRM49041]|uniref:hypothetical protein n=1 Tax=Streptomyces sp. TRM49041 TaxID=2603216 RepID=UPI0011ED1D9F|nr:hypothetical protein [Streptomyces sp. TRM49041]
MTHDMGRGTPPEPPNSPNGPYPPGPGGWGGWWMPPPPKPGVIPLGPLGLGQVLGGAFATVRRAWKPLYGLALIVFCVPAVFTGASMYQSYSTTKKHFRELSFGAPGGLPDLDLFSAASAAAILLSLGGLLAMLIGNAVLQTASVAALRHTVVGRAVTFGALWREVRPRVRAVIVVGLLTALIFVVPYVLLVLGIQAAVASAWDAAGGPALINLPGWLIPVGLLGGLLTGILGIWLWVRFTFAPAAVVLEGLGPIAAMRRSAQLVKGDSWRVFGISLLALVIAAAAALVIQLPFQLVGMVALFSEVLPDADEIPTVDSFFSAMIIPMVIGMVGQFVGQCVAAPLTPLANGLLYVDRRIRTENLAVSLAEAAGVRLPAQPQPPQPYIPPQAGPYGPPPAG